MNRQVAATPPSRSASGRRCTTRCVGLGVSIEPMDPVPGCPTWSSRPTRAWSSATASSARGSATRSGKGRRHTSSDWARRHGFRSSSPPDGSPLRRGRRRPLLRRHAVRRLPLPERRAEPPVGRRAAGRARCLPLELVDPRFYHLDTCFCPLSEDRPLYYPGRLRRLWPVGAARADRAADRGLGRGGGLVQLQRVVVGRAGRAQRGDAKLARALGAADSRCTRSGSPSSSSRAAAPSA